MCLVACFIGTGIRMGGSATAGRRGCTADVSSTFLALDLGGTNL